MIPTRSDEDREAGFTLIELLVVMVMSIAVLFATLNALDVFSDNADRQTRITRVNETARQLVDRTADDLRNAATIRTAAANDLVYSVVEPTGTRTARLCLLGTALYSSSSTTSTAPGSACGVAASGWTQAQIATVPASTTTAFTYDGAASSTTPGTVRSVGMTFNLDAGTRGRAGASTLRASATVRRTSGSLPIGEGDLRADCNASGALLTLDVGALTGLNIASVTYESMGGILLGVGNATTPIQIPEGITSLVALITDAAGVTQTVNKVVECS